MGIILSGVQPTKELHLGNYLGAIKNWVSLQSEHKCLFMLADLHAITVHQEPVELRENVLKVAALYIACGIDPKKSIIFNQSRVSGHAELAWVLGCNTPLGWLNRMTQFKEKVTIEADSKAGIGLPVNIKFHDHASNDEVANALKIIKKVVLPGNLMVENAGLGLFAYPVLMAADILLYNATHVPVGDDQKQHLELARDIAGAFNRNFKTEFFTIPEALFTKSGARVMSLQDATKKMSKSDESEYSRINLTDDNDTIRNKAKKAKTDSIAEVYYDAAARPDVAGLLNLLGVLTGKTAEAAAKELEGKKSSDLKSALADALIAVVEPIRTKYLELLNDRIMLNKILDEGAAKANDIAHAMQSAKVVGTGQQQRLRVERI